MALSVSYFNDKPVYNLSAGKSAPQFVEEAEKNNKSLRYNEEFRNRLELLQDFEFETTSSKVKVSPDGKYICATGGYILLFNPKSNRIHLCDSRVHSRLFN